MAETHWDDIRGSEVRYTDHTWELTGDVDIRERGELLVVEATQSDDVRGRTAFLHFGLQNPPSSLNPGDLGELSDGLERVDGDYHLVVTKGPRTYRYGLQRLERE